MTIEDIYKTSTEDETIRSQTTLGFCREWTRRVISLIRIKFPNIKVEAREVDITPNLQHTFVRITDENEEPFLYDGVGTTKHKPYFGPEKEAPNHLQNSKSDIINSYL